MQQAPLNQYLRLAGRHSYHIGMADPHVISVLRTKRAKLAGLIDGLERQVHNSELTWFMSTACCGYASQTAIRQRSNQRVSIGSAAASLAASWRLCLEAFRDTARPPKAGLRTYLTRQYHVRSPSIGDETEGWEAAAKAGPR